jgi:hypothetical protein
MRVRDLFESYDELRTLILLSTSWLKNIEQQILRAEELYDYTNEPSDRRDFIEALDVAKAEIIKTVNSPILTDTTDPAAKKITQQYTELYFKLMNKRV